jgi:hypothetical protein
VDITDTGIDPTFLEALDASPPTPTTSTWHMTFPISNPQLCSMNLTFLIPFHLSISISQYSPVFVHFPKSPSPYPRQWSTTAVEISKPLSPKSTAYTHIPIPPMPSEVQPVKRTGLSRLRSLSILKPKKQPSSPPSVAASAPKSEPTRSKKHLAPPQNLVHPPSTIAKRKRAKYLIDMFYQSLKNQDSLSHC